LVNYNFEKFRKIQSQHKSEYGGERGRGSNKDDYNTQENTDKSPGATGRTV